MKILITGATGFIGQHLVQTLGLKQRDIRCLVRPKSNIDKLRKYPVDFCCGDITDKDSLIKATKNIDLVFHLVGIGSLTDYSQSAFLSYKKINVEGTKNLLEACEHNQVKGVVYFSSLAAQGTIADQVVTEKTKAKPQIPYEKSKYQSELVVERFRKKASFPITIIRPAHVYGPGAKSSDILLLARIIKRRFCPIIGGGNNIIPLVYVKDLVRASVKLTAKKRLPNKKYNITREEPIKYKDLCKNIQKAVAAPCLFVHLPIGVAKFGAFLLEFFSLIAKKPAIVTSKRIDSLTTNRLYDVSLAQKDLGFCSTDFFQTIKETINWYKINQYL